MENRMGWGRRGVVPAVEKSLGRINGLLFPLGILIVLLGSCYAAIVQHMPENMPYATLAQRAYATELSSRGFVHVKARARVLPDAEFGAVSPEGEMKPVELWRTDNPSQHWSVTCGNEAFIGCDREQFSVRFNERTPQVQCGGASICRPQVGFVGCFLWGATLIDMEESRVWQQGLIATREQWTDTDGDVKVTLNISPPSRHVSSTIQPGEQCHWFDLRNSKRYVIDLKTGRIESACVYLVDHGREVILFQTEQIEYVNESDGQGAMNGLLAEAGL